MIMADLNFFFYCQYKSASSKKDIVFENQAKSLSNLLMDIPLNWLFLETAETISPFFSNKKQILHWKCIANKYIHYSII